MARDLSVLATVDDARSLRPVSVAELLMRPAPRWLVRGVLPERSLAVIYGQPGSGKTFIALDLAASIARGVEWAGRRVRQAGVVYVAAEGHLQLRIGAYLKHNNLAAHHLPLLRFMPGNVDLLSPACGDLDTLIGEIRAVGAELGGVGLVTIDTLNAAMGGADENSSVDMGLMIAAARRIIDAAGATVTLIHHSGKDESRGARGHSSLVAAVDAEIRTTGESDRIAEITKMRDGEGGQRFGFQLHPVDLGPDDDGERLSSCVVLLLDHAPAPKTKAVRRDVAFDALREAIGEHGERLPGTSTIPPGTRAVKLDVWRARWGLRAGYEDGSESARTNFNKDRRALLTAGAIGISMPWVWINR